MATVGFPPKLQDLLEKLKPLASSLSSFVQQNPSPASFVQQKIVPQVQQGIQNWKAKPSNVLAKQIYTGQTPFQQTMVRQTIPQLNQFLQGGINRLYPEPPSIPAPFRVLPNIGRQFAKGMLSDIATQATIGTPQQQRLSQFLTKLTQVPFNQWSLPERKEYADLATKEGINYAIGMMGGLRFARAPQGTLAASKGFAGAAKEAQALQDFGLKKTQAEVENLIKNNSPRLEEIKTTLQKEISDILSLSSQENLLPRTATKVAAYQNLIKRIDQATSPYLNPMGGIGREVARQGYTANEIIKMKPQEGIEILQGKDFNQLANQVAVTKKVNILDYFRTPEAVLNKIGLGDIAKKLRSSWEGYQAQLPSELDKIRNWMQQASGKEANEKIFNWLDGVNVELTPNELKVATEIKSYLKEWADKLELPQYKRVSDYITHLYEVGQITQEFDEDLAKIIDPRIAKEVYDPFLQKRLGTRIDYLRDTWGALQAYVKRATRKYFMDPALEQLSQQKSSLELSQEKYVKRLTDRINMRPTEIDNLIDNFLKSVPGIGYRFGQRPVTILSQGTRQMVYRGTIGLNVSSALRNLTQGTNTYAELGEKYTLLGYLRLLKNWRSTELQDTGVLRDSFITDQTQSVFKNALGAIDKGLMALFQTAEKVNRGAAYFGAKAKALEQGLSETQAIEKAKEIVRKTQFVFGAIDTPVILSSDLAKTIGQLQTYNIKQLEFLLTKIGKKEFTGMIRWVGSMLVLSKVLKDQFGMRLDLLPIHFSLTPSLQAGQGTLQMVAGNVEEGKTNLAKTIPAFIPGGVQMKKMIEGLKAFKQEASLTPTGRTRFEIEQTPGNFLKSVFMGQWSTPGAQEYIGNLGKSKSQILYEELSKLPPEQAAAQVKQLKETNPAGYKAFVDYMNDKAMKITTEEKNLRNLTVKDGARAKALVKMFNSEDTPEKKANLYKRYLQAGVITDEIAKQLNAARQAGVLR